MDSVLWSDRIFGTKCETDIEMDKMCFQIINVVFTTDE